MGSRQGDMPRFGRAVSGHVLVGVALLGQHAEHTRAVGADQRARRDRGSGELDKLFGPGRIGHAQTYPAQQKFLIHLCPNIFHRNHDGHLVR